MRDGGAYENHLAGPARAHEPRSSPECGGAFPAGRARLLTFRRSLSFRFSPQPSSRFATRSFRICAPPLSHELRGKPDGRYAVDAARGATRHRTGARCTRMPPSRSWRASARSCSTRSCSIACRPGGLPRSSLLDERVGRGVRSTASCSRRPLDRCRLVRSSRLRVAACPDHARELRARRRTEVIGASGSTCPEASAPSAVRPAVPRPSITGDLRPLLAADGSLPLGAAMPAFPAAGRALVGAAEERKRRPNQRIVRSTRGDRCSTYQTSSSIRSAHGSVARPFTCAHPVSPGRTSRRRRWRCRVRARPGSARSVAARSGSSRRARRSTAAAARRSRFGGGAVPTRVIRLSPASTA